MEKTASRSAGKSRVKNGNLSPRRRIYEIVMRALLYISSGLTVALLLFIIGTILVDGVPGLSWQFLTTQESVINDTNGILPAIQNTLYVIVVTLIIVLPLGVGAAIYLTEYAGNRRLVAAIEYATETLAGIPSILYALVGMLVFCQMMGLGKTLLAGSLTLVIMTLPTIIRTTQESLKTVPASYREGALGLGATKWYMIRTIVLPSSLEGIITGCILAVGRIVGESAALLFTAGVGTVIAKNVFAAFSRSGGTLSVALYMYVSERGEFDVGYAIAAILMVLVLGLNAATRLVRNRMKKKEGAQ